MILMRNERKMVMEKKKRGNVGKIEKGKKKCDYCVKKVWVLMRKVDRIFQSCEKIIQELISA